MNQCGMTFAQNLKRLRIAAGLTQEQLAHACGYSGQSRIGNYESSQPKARQPKPDELPMIASALGVSVGQLFGESQTLRLNPTMIAETVSALRIVYARRGVIFDAAAEADATIFIAAYRVRERMPRAISQTDLVERVADVVSIKGAGDGRSDGVQVGGVDRGSTRKRAGKS